MREGDSFQFAGMETNTHQTFGNLHSSSLWKLTDPKSIISHHIKPTMRHKSTPTSNCTWGKETACWNGNLHTSSLWTLAHIKSIIISHCMQPTMRHKSTLTSNCTWGKETACKSLEWKPTHIKPLETYINSITKSHHMQPVGRHKSPPTSNCTWGKEMRGGTKEAYIMWKATGRKGTYFIRL